MRPVRCCRQPADNRAARGHRLVAFETRARVASETRPFASAPNVSAKSADGLTLDVAGARAHAMLSRCVPSWTHRLASAAGRPAPAQRCFFPLRKDPGGRAVGAESGATTFRRKGGTRDGENQQSLARAKSYAEKSNHAAADRVAPSSREGMRVPRNPAVHSASNRRQVGGAGVVCRPRSGAIRTLAYAGLKIEPCMACASPRAAAIGRR